jgi:hypothetical protein
MKKRQIQLIIASMALALLGVIAFQLFWINHAIAVKNEQFTQQVHNALQAVVMKLERQEAMQIVARKLKSQETLPPVIQSAQVYTPADEVPAAVAVKKSKSKPQPWLASTQKKSVVTLVPAVKTNRKTAHVAHAYAYGWNNNLLTQDTLCLLIDGQTIVLPNNLLQGQRALQQYQKYVPDSVSMLIDEGLWPHTIHKQMPELKMMMDMQMQHLLFDLQWEEMDQQLQQTSRERVKGREGIRIERRTMQPEKRRSGLSTEPREVRDNHYQAYIEDVLQHRLPNAYTFAFADDPEAASYLHKNRGSINSRLRLPGQLIEWKSGRDSLLYAFTWQSSPGVKIMMAESANALETELVSERKNKKTAASGIRTRVDSAVLMKNDLKKNFEKVQHKSEIVGDVFRELVRKEQPITERVSQKTLDSLLSIEIRNRQIDIPYQSGVLMGQQHKVVLASTGQAAMQIPDNVYKTALFPTDVFSSNDMLFVYFPTQQEFIMGKMWTVFTSSGVLILVILCCFYFAIATILKQKKLSDVKNDFINNMTHEFKTPISTISLACEVLQDEAVNKNITQMNRYLHIIRDENKRLGLQVEKVLQAAMLDRGEIKLKLTEVDMHEVIDHVLHNIGVQIEKREGKVDLQLEAELTVIEADEVHITNIFIIYWIMPTNTLWNHRRSA